MSLFDERALREIVAEEVRRVLREELSERGRSGSDVELFRSPKQRRGWR
jgi:hypothetical protein